MTFEEVQVLYHDALLDEVKAAVEYRKLCLQLTFLTSEKHTVETNWKNKKILLENSYNNLVKAYEDNLS